MRTRVTNPCSVRIRLKKVKISEVLYAALMHILFFMLIQQFDLIIIFVLIILMPEADFLDDVTPYDVVILSSMSSSYSKCKGKTSEKYAKCSTSVGAVLTS